MIVKTIPSDKSGVTRNKDAKIRSIIDATRTLIETMGYEQVTIRDIAKSACVSVGLIYKYFPNGKFDIIFKGIGSQCIDELIRIQQPETVDFNDFSGYIREAIKKLLQLVNENKPLLRAMAAAALSSGEIMDEVKKLDVNDYTTISEFFSRFNGVDITDENSAKLLTSWGVTIKGIIIYNIIYPRLDDTLEDLLVDLSLKIWGYKAPR